ncbi:hypothetical protein Oweho_2322 [Owenweeksia hongkongensis DSM 17368]|uniref:Fibronectin type-III domain-containing protein n=1 Tax=Owenweeksia hongkongensis (strain DSM 17368 / CIP 108786 / JCM 12287 / NRRL B-23963 / UST20020801) TaxID=926562 RepID=G8R674_OWEHD|nr:LamG-like jellyroll fold domain-containing protein [Owenweeksia hongkongensis]AEV33294.1 hypothetical protein Oweho_2322 [Owenweeksia hongkongensis DSM 17368]
MSKVRTFLLSCFALLALGAWAQQGGAGSALYFPATSASEHLRLDTAINDVIDTTDFTIEWWMRGEAMSGDPGIIANKNWNSGNNPGFIVARTGSSTIKVNGRFSGGSRFDLNNVSIPALETDWVHIAIVFDRRSSHPDLKIYANGLIVDSLVLSGSVPTGAMAPNYPIVVGQDGTGSYGHKYKGTLDEVRIWNEARTADDIRTTMCHSLVGTETALVAAYSFNNISGSVVPDATGMHDALLINAPSVVSSGAAVGDTSVFVYPTSWSAQSLNLNSAANGNITLDSIQNGAAGLHLYRTTAAPSSVTGIKALATNDVFFGAYAVADTGIEYNITYDYSSFALAVANEDSLELFARGGGDSLTWKTLPAARYKTNDEIKTRSLSGKYNEVILANFAGYVCAAPSLGTSSNITYNSAQLAWTSGGALVWDIEYGSVGFTAGTGTLISGITSNPYTLNGLIPSTNYEFYVRDNCGSLGSSVWVGPFSFATTAAPACNAPSSLSVSSLGFNSANLNWVTGGSNLWNVEYGTTGFTLGSGAKLDSVYTNSYFLNGLSPNTTYDFYVQDTCNFANASAWVGPFTFTTLNDYSKMGSGTSLSIDGNGYVDLSGGKVSAESIGLPDSAITLEAWVKPSSFGQWKSIVSFIQDNGNFERGWDLETSNNNKLAFALKSDSASSLTYLETTNSFNTDEWMHVAGVYDGDTMKIYVNGVLEASSTSQTGAIDYADSWLVIGSYKDDNEDNRVDAEIDEVRIWNSARSASEIRQYMCQKLNGNEADLVSYYTLNEGSGTSVMDQAGNNHGTFTALTPAAWQVSGAHIGDTSVYAYATDYSQVALSLASAGFGDVAIDSIINNPEGIHLYKVDTLPNFTLGISDLGNQEVHFGVFLAEGSTNASYNFTYDYSGFADAVSNEAFLNIYNRKDASYHNWVNTGAARLLNNDEVKLTATAANKQLILADFTAPSCASSTGLTATNVQFFYADIAWTAGAAGTWKVEYDKSGFAIGSGMKQTISGTPATTLSGLQHSTTYDYYVKDSCSTTDQSSWVGPFTFTTMNVCPEADSLSVVSVTGNSATFSFSSTGTNADWDIQWGPTGFTPGVGIITKVSGNPADLLNLSKSTTYDAYVRANCDSINSGWIGPVTFTTDSIGGFSIGENNLANSLNVFPNPNHGEFTISVELLDQFTISILDLSGKVIYSHTQLNGGKWEEKMTWKELPKGLYIIKLNNDEGHFSRKMIIE